ncbi:MAG: hypothetical protein ACOZNI_30300 [Myxococcota bacterium]
MLALLIGCDEPGPDAADAFFDEHPRGTAIAQYGDVRWEGAVGARWHGVDLAGWLAPCGPVGDFDTSFSVAPGEFPWEVDDDDLPACVAERLATFPFDAPSARGEREIVRIRWRPDEPVPASSTSPRGAVPPFAVVNARHWTEDDGFVRWKGGEVLPLHDAEGWARELTCPADTLDLVRVAIAFDDGEFEWVHTVPENDCVEEKARQTEGGPSLVVLDVPVGPW